MTESNSSLGFDLREDERPLIAIVLGSGLGKLADRLTDPRVIPYAKIPGFPVSTVEGHEGALCFGKLEGIPVVCMKGRVHYYEGYSMQQVTYPTRLLKSLGVKHFFLTNASGGIRADFAPGTLMIVEDHISTFVPSPFLGLPVSDYGGIQFVDMSGIYDTELLQKAAKLEQVPVEQGVYLQTSGPAYETPAEVRMFRTLGADAVGMSTTVEAAMAHALGMKVYAVSCITNKAAGLSEKKLSHEDVKEAADLIAVNLTRLTERLVQLVAEEEKGTGKAESSEKNDKSEEKDKPEKKDKSEKKDKPEKKDRCEKDDQSEKDMIAVPGISRNVTLYTDGSARNNPDGPGGYGAVLLFRDGDGNEIIREMSQGYERTTNNRMEMMAVISGLEFLQDPCEVTVYSDSQYIVNAFNQHWLTNWIKNNWKRGKDPVKNVDLWKRMLRAMEPHKVEFVWVRGHAGNHYNEICDQLATSAADNGPWIADTQYMESLKQN